MGGNYCRCRIAERQPSIDVADVGVIAISLISFAITALPNDWKSSARITKAPSPQITFSI